MAIKPTTSATPRNPLAGMIGGSEIPLRESLVARGWKHLTADEREVVLLSYIAAWQVSWERREPQPSAVTVFDARQTIMFEIPGHGPVERNLGPTRYQGSITHAEREGRLEAKCACLKAADSARYLSFALRVEAASKLVDRRIVYTPTSPDRSEEVRNVTTWSCPRRTGPPRRWRSLSCTPWAIASASLCADGLGCSPQTSQRAAA
jgi:hypothetical protein